MCLTAAMLAGCATTGSSPSAYQSGYETSPSRKRTSLQEDAAKSNIPKMIERKSRLEVTVSDIPAAAETASAIVAEKDGFIQNRSDSGEGKYASFTIRVPVDNFDDTIADLKKLGTVKSHSVDSRDVTAEYVDAEARLQSLIVLRDRLKTLLDRAVTISDVLAIEKEFTRVQSEIDSFEARMSILENRSSLSTIDLSLERKQILGPLGFVGKWLLRGIEVLFVIRD